ncbi:MAG TPA: HAMP domain-containing sensor histidine kinase [Vicinamibacterales bacterium]
MLHQFITEHRDVIVERAASLARVRDPLLNNAPKEEISHFLTQVSARLRQGSDRAVDATSFNETAVRNGANMRRGGHPVVNVVQSYGDVCQAVTAIAVESSMPISADDFSVFNQCLDQAIGQAVTEYNRMAEDTRAAAELQRLGMAAHELRDQLQTAQLSLRSLQSSRTAIDGLSGQLLERALRNLSGVVDRMLSDFRFGAGLEQRESIEIGPFLQEVATAAALNAESRGLTFTIDSETTGTIWGDRQLLMSAVMNLVNNALKYSRAGSNIRVTVRMTSTRLYIAVQDQCGGLPESGLDVAAPFADRRGTDRTGLGLGLSIAKNVIRSHGGDIAVRNIPGSGCVFTIDMPLAPPSCPPTVAH